MNHPSISDQTTDDLAYFLVIGPKRAGKSSFINAVVSTNSSSGGGSGGGGSSKTKTSEVLVVNHDGTQPTTKPFEYVCVVDDRFCCFVDTPGIYGEDNKFGVEIDASVDIHRWLDSMYRKGQKLTGVICIFSVHYPMPTSYEIAVLEDMCGKAAMNNVVLVRTKWDDLENSESHKAAEAMEADWILGDGIGLSKAVAKMFHHDNTPESARLVVKTLLGREPVFLHCQRRLEDNRKSPGTTVQGENISVVSSNMAPAQAGWMNDLAQRSEGNKQSVEDIEKEVEAYMAARDKEDAEAKQQRQEVMKRFWSQHLQRQGEKSKQRWRWLRWVVLGLLVTGIAFAAAPTVTRYARHKRDELNAKIQKEVQILQDWLSNSVTLTWIIPTRNPVGTVHVADVGQENVYLLSDSDFRAMEIAIESYVEARLDQQPRNNVLVMTDEEKKKDRAAEQAMSTFLANRFGQDHKVKIDNDEVRTMDGFLEESHSARLECKDQVCVPVGGDDIISEVSWTSWINWRVVVALLGALVAGFWYDRLMGQYHHYSECHQFG